MTFLGILGLVAALAFGIYWGLPTSYRPDMDEIEDALSDDGRETRKVERQTTFLSLMQRRMMKGSDRRRSRRTRRPFQLDQDDR